MHALATLQGTPLLTLTGKGWRQLFATLTARGFRLPLATLTAGITYRQRNVDATKEVVFSSRASWLGDLLEEPTQALDALYFVEFADHVQHASLIVVIPESQHTEMITELANI